MRMPRNNERIKAKITGNIRPDWNDPKAHLFTLPDLEQFTKKEVICMPFYWQYCQEDRPPVIVRKLVGIGVE